jgi:hypothetical protein
MQTSLQILHLTLYFVKELMKFDQIPFRRYACLNGGLMTAKPSRFFWTILLALLTACGGVTPLATETPTATQIPVTKTLTPLPTFTPAIFPTLGPYSTATVTSTPIPFPAPIPVSTATEIYPLDNLRMAYIVDGNLYVQNGNNPPKKLSESGEDWFPMFSDDGEKIVFYRGKVWEFHNSIFSVNADGSQMREIITTAWLDTLGAGTKAGHLAFVPNTHQIIFNTYQCPEYDRTSDSGCIVGLFLIDSDTGKIKKIMKPALGGWLPISGDAIWIRNFSISPDGRLLSIAHAGQIDIFDIEGNIIHRSIMTYSPTMPFELYPRVYWFPDSNGLIVALPAETEYIGPLQGGDPDYTIWRYTFDGNVVTQILLDPPPTWIHMVESNDVLSVSPNREWVIYFTEDYKLYKGNLLDGSTELLLPGLYYLPMQWSSDSTHFANSGSSVEPILGSVDAPPGYIFRVFIGWIDAKRFIYVPNSAEGQENVQLLVGETKGAMLSSYETKVFVPTIAPYSYVFAFTISNSKAK